MGQTTFVAQCVRSMTARRAAFVAGETSIFVPGLSKRASVLLIN